MRPWFLFLPLAANRHSLLEGELLAALVCEGRTSRVHEKYVAAVVSQLSVVVVLQGESKWYGVPLLYGMFEPWDI